VAEAFWISAALAAALHGAHVIVGLGRQSLAWVASPWAVFAIFMLCAAAVTARAIAARSRRDRLVWTALAAGLALYALGTPAYFFFPPDLDAPKFVSAAHLLWLAVYPAALLAIGLLVASHATHARRSQWVDGVIGGLAAASVGAIVVFRVVVDPAHAFGLAPLFVSFTLGDILVIGFGIGAYALVGWRPPRAVVLLVAGFAVMIIADAAYLETVADNEPVDVAWPYSIWIAAGVTIAAAAVFTRPRGGHAPGHAPRGQRKIAYPVVASLIALTVAVCQSPDEQGAEFSLPLAALAIIAVIAQLVTTLRRSDALVEALADSEAHLAEAQRLAGVGTWTWNALDGSTTSSVEMRRLHNWAGGGSPGLVDAFDLVVPEDRPTLEAAFAAASEHGTPLTLDYRVPAPGGTKVMHLQGMAMLDSDGNKIGLRGTCQDVTESVRRAEAERANHAKSEFLSRMSHELRTPLNAILGFGQLLATSDLRERQRASVDQILTAGTHLLGLINEILEISRIETGEMSLSLEPVDVSAVVDEAIAMMAPLAVARGVSVAVEPIDPDVRVNADQQRLKQVLINLLANAIKYNRDDGRVTVSCRPSHDRVRLAVADTGDGIAPELVARAFQPFERLGAELSDVDGTGLGLPLAKGMVAAMGGRIDVQSTPGAGATFTIELDAAAPATPLEPPPACAPDPGPVPERTPTLLCIEDNPSSLALLEQILERRPALKLLTARRGDEGAELAARHRPDVVVLDLDLPDVGGEQVLAALHADPLTADVPIVILTASAHPRQRTRLLAAGADAYLTKPIDVAEFLRVIDDTVLTTSPQ
jgi:CheY-like chemotaxis protein